MPEPATPTDPFAAVPKDSFCDLIMKGGITSGVVYPAAILKLAARYRFKSVSGTSAGAIAAAGAAAAELGREKTTPGAGFPGLAALQAELAGPGTVAGSPSRLLELFTPPACAPTRPVFDRIVKLLGSTEADRKDARPLNARIRAGVRKALRLGWVAAVAAAVLLTLVAWLAAGGYAVAAAAVIFVSFGVAAGFLIRARRAAAAYGVAYDGFYAQNFGIAYGHRDDGPEGLTDYLHRKFRELAGLPPGGVLTFKHLRDGGISLQLMTSNLSLGRPYVFPLPKGTVFLFKRSEFLNYFPAEVVDAMTKAAGWGRKTVPADEVARLTAAGRPVMEAVDPCAPFPVDPAAAADLYYLPAGDALPVVVAARMSLSFPGLFSTVPLYTVTQDYVERWWQAVKQAKRAGGDATVPGLTTDARDIRRNLFSDGGVVNNFPIQMFDEWFPSHPTFGINLADALKTEPGNPDLVDDSYLVCPRGLQPGMERPDPARVHLPAADAATAAEWQEITSVWELFWAIFYTAKNHRDNAQAELPGFRERVVTVRLADNEGGLNLNMPQDLVKTIQGYGATAGDVLVDGYANGPGFAHHRWVRLRLLLAHLERELRALQAAVPPPPQAGAKKPPPPRTAFEHWLHDVQTGKPPAGPVDKYPFPLTRAEFDAAIGVLEKMRVELDVYFPPAAAASPTLGPFDIGPPTPEPLKRFVPPDSHA